jgi:tRNA (cytidine/uridine-2'-O-)-methyltransferase
MAWAAFPPILEIRRRKRAEAESGAARPARLPPRASAAPRRSAVPLRLALYQPDIPQNTGTILRLCACMGVAADIIEPAGFPVSDRAFRRAGMDYLDKVAIERHVSWTTFEAWRREAGLRLVLATTKGAEPYAAFDYRDGDIVMLGRESAGVPDAVHAAADARVFIPMRPGLRSLNIAVAASMILGEALRQTGGFPPSGGAPRSSERPPA